jgi:hypothetical protein
VFFPCGPAGNFEMCCVGSGTGEGSRLCAEQLASTVSSRRNKTFEVLLGRSVCDITSRPTITLYRKAYNGSSVQNRYNEYPKDTPTE